MHDCEPATTPEQDVRACPVLLSTPGPSFPVAHAPDHRSPEIRGLPRSSLSVTVSAAHTGKTLGSSLSTCMRLCGVSTLTMASLHWVVRNPSALLGAGSVTFSAVRRSLACLRGPVFVLLLRVAPGISPASVTSGDGDSTSFSVPRGRCGEREGHSWAARSG